MKRENGEKRENGFSLVELLIVIAIIGILAGIAYLGIPAIRRAVYQKSALTSFAVFKTAQQSFKDDQGYDRYATLAELAALKVEGVSVIEQVLIDAAGAPQDYHTWKIEQLETPGKRKYGYRLCSTDTIHFNDCYTLYEDGPIRQISRDAAPARNAGTPIK